jgi:superfamily II DNA or RNA helicase
VSIPAAPHWRPKRTAAKLSGMSAVALSENTGIQLSFEGGTIVVEGLPDNDTLGLPGLRRDVRRAGVHRAEAIYYRSIVRHLIDNKIAYRDEARSYEKTRWPIRIDKPAFPHQTEALEAWVKGGMCGVVVLPTGTGKTHLANLCIHRAERPTLVVTPTIDLLNQWYDELSLCFGVEVGLVGGGYHDVKPLTVTTYDSAHQQMERLGHRFGLVIFDECHHLPGPTYGHAAICAIAPFRLGLTATPERADNAHEHLDYLIGPIVYRREITELRGRFLAEYRVETLYVNLTDEERFRYEAARETYRNFLRENGIDLRQPGAWGRFLYAAHSSPAGKQAYLAYREQRALALAAPGKLRLLSRLLDRHNGDRIIIFTHDNATVYKIAREFLVPVITHQTKTKERREILLRFNSGEYPIVATSKVLNEGVNVPEANMAVILSGSSTVREHVQRLGRILRKSGDKEALLYEVVARGTVEEFSSNRRRQHTAYDGGEGIRS